LGKGIAGIETRLSNEINVISVVPQNNVLGTLVYLVYVNNIWRNIHWSIKLFADDSIIYRKENKNDK
jgi:hypothetical protein